MNHEIKEWIKNENLISAMKSQSQDDMVKRKELSNLLRGIIKWTSIGSKAREKLKIQSVLRKSRIENSGEI